MSPFSVVIPAYNEEHGIASVIEAVRAQGWDCDVIVVDDGSVDGTARAAEGAGATVFRHPANGGYGMSLKDGIGKARHDIVVIIDADGSYPVERIADLVLKIEDGFDMAVGARQGTQQYDRLLMAPARLLFRFLVEFTTGASIPDINSGLRSFRKSEVLPFFPDLCRGFSFTTTLTLIYTLTGKYVIYLPIAYHRRIGTSKVNAIRDSLRTLQYLVEVIVAYNPLKLFLLLAVPLKVLAAAALVWGIVSRQPVPLLIAAVFLSFALVILGLGLLTYMVKKGQHLTGPVHLRGRSAGRVIPGARQTADAEWGRE